MRKDNKIYLYTVGLIMTLMVIVLSGCSHKNTRLAYFEDLGYSESGVLTMEVPPLRIVPEDSLFVTITSLRPEATAMYNRDGGTSICRVDQNGNIILPVIGIVSAAGKTTDEIATEIQERVEENVVDPIVTVQLRNFHINVLGEVKEPGVVLAGKEQFTVLDAIAMAGDITEYGQRENVLLLRKEDDKTKYYHLNLKDSRLLSSPLYYLRQNDVIIVEPNSIKKDNSTYNINNSYRLQVISTIVSASSVVASLAIALAIK